jgi:hypothetical protein
MKRYRLVLIGMLSAFGCDRLGGGDIDYKLLEKPEEVAKLHAQWLEKMGEHAKRADEVDVMVKKNDGAGHDFIMTVTHQSPSDKNRMHRIQFFSMPQLNGWQDGQDVEIQVFGGNPEDYRIEDDLFDFTFVSVETINKVIADARSKYADTSKYKDQYVSNLKIDENGFNVQVSGKLASNDQIKTESYDADLAGSPR